MYQKVTLLSAAYFTTPIVLSIDRLKWLGIINTDWFGNVNTHLLVMDLSNDSS